MRIAISHLRGSLSNEKILKLFRDNRENGLHGFNKYKIMKLSINLFEFGKV